MSKSICLNLKFLFMLRKKQIKQILEKTKILTNKEFGKLLSEAQKNNKSLENYLIEKKIITSSLLYKNAAEYYKLPFIDLEFPKIKKEAMLKIPETIANTYSVIAFDINDKEIKIATTNPENLQIFEFIKKKLEKEIKIYITSPENIKEGLRHYQQNIKTTFEDFEKNEKNESLEKKAEDQPIIKIVDSIIEYAINQDASDIHIEPGEKGIKIRYRIDGMLTDIMSLSKKTQEGILARIKILTNLKVDEHRLPQDGRFKISNEKYKISFRVSTIPTIDGEKIVIRLLNEDVQILSLEQLGFQQDSLEIIQRNIKKPNGMILATGPTGSGKTTTLYTILNYLNKPEVNISTVEDPIEYRMHRVNQTQINHKIGFSFALGLRALLRQDPDIIMVGEIRDEETAQIAVHAAMTGHLVLSTLHTNSAVATLPRLTDMDVPPYLIASTVNLIIAQRLARKICPNCIQSYNLDIETIKKIEKNINIDKILKTLAKRKIISQKVKSLKSLLFYKGKGCSKCNETGYKGRIGVYETLEVTPEISNLIAKKTDSGELAKEAEKQGMLTMLEDGFIKAKNGITTLEEIIRVTKE